MLNKQNRLGLIVCVATVFAIAGIVWAATSAATNRIGELVNHPQVQGLPMSSQEIELIHQYRARPEFFTFTNEERVLLSNFRSDPNNFSIDGEPVVDGNELSEPEKAAVRLVRSGAESIAKGTDSDRIDRVKSLTAELRMKGPRDGKYHGKTTPPHIAHMQNLSDSSDLPRIGDGNLRISDTGDRSRE